MENDDSEEYWDAYYGDINARSATKIMDYSTILFDTNPVDLAGVRTALSLLLNSSKDEDRKVAAQLDNKNLDDTAIGGPEKFYSYVVLTEYYASPPAHQTKEANNDHWESVLKYSQLAIQQRLDEKGALGSALDNNRSITAFWLKAHSLHKIDQNGSALETCRQAFDPIEFQFTKKNMSLLEFITLILILRIKENNFFDIIKDFQQIDSTMKKEWLW
jgi:hypothetical protein